MSLSLEPLVLVLDRPTELRIGPLTPNKPYTIRVRPARALEPVQTHNLHADSRGWLHVRDRFSVPGEHLVDIAPSPEGLPLARRSFYAAPPDLARRRPLRCDMHIHTLYSDGRSPPGEMLVRGRELGLDVAVITDHNAYRASIEAIEARDTLGLNLVTMPGEELSAPDWHILSINAGASIFELARRTFDLDQATEAERLSRFGSYDALRWAIDAVHEYGGRAYLAHPYWAVSRGYHLPVALYERALEEEVLDGLELLGDVKQENNLRSLARYVDLRAQGGDLPILGNSDTHRSAHTYGAYWTLAFVAGEPSPESVLQAIAEGWSVACTTAHRAPLSEDRATDTLALGTFELVDYSYFLEQQFYPQHDALCAEEAALAYRVLRGDTLPEGAMAGCREEMEGLYARCWAGLNGRMVT